MRLPDPPKQKADKDETETSTQTVGRYYRKPERESTSWHLEQLTNSGNNASKLSKAIQPYSKASQHGISKKILVQLEAALELSSSRKEVGIREDT